MFGETDVVQWGWMDEWMEVTGNQQRLWTMFRVVGYYAILQNERSHGKCIGVRFVPVTLSNVQLNIYPFPNGNIPHFKMHPVSNLISLVEMSGLTPHLL